MNLRTLFLFATLLILTCPALSTAHASTEIKPERFFAKTTTQAWVELPKPQAYVGFYTFHGISLPNIYQEQKETLLPLQENTSYTKLEKIPEKILVEKKDDHYVFSGKLIPGEHIDPAHARVLLAKAETNAKIKGIVLHSITIPGTVVLKQDGKEAPLEIFAEGVSHFDGSTQSRIHNINTAMNLFIGKTIAPHSDFSFNSILGVVDGSTGYKKELVIKGDKTIPEYGGGVCQVSSTFFRAALHGGLPILERKPHSYAVSYYQPWGTDATVYPGVVDLKFKNDSDSELIIYPFIVEKTLYVHFYGKKDGRTVEVNGPNIYGNQGYPAPDVEYVTTLAPGRRVLKEYGHPGFASWWERTVIKTNGEKNTEKFNSIYEARPAKMLEGKAV